jgi:hypothetical protein
VRLIHGTRAMLVVAQASACVRNNEVFTPHVDPVYDTTTGKLRLLQNDSNGDGKIDTWSYMNGSQVVRIEVDRDGDGRVDQWQYYEGSQKVQKVGSSMRGDRKPDGRRSTGAESAGRSELVRWRDWLSRSESQARVQCRHDSPGLCRPVTGVRTAYVRWFSHLRILSAVLESPAERPFLFPRIGRLNCKDSFSSVATHCI